jgi:hypothetical protein
MRATLLRAFVLLSLAVILLGMPMLFHPHRIRPESFERIRAGMTEAEVQELLGAPAGNYDGFKRSMIDIYPVSGLVLPAEPGDDKFWASRHGAVRVSFDNHGRVVDHRRHMSVASTWWARLWHRLVPKQQIDSRILILVDE